MRCFLSGFARGTCEVGGCKQSMLCISDPGVLTPLEAVPHFTIKMIVIRCCCDSFCTCEVKEDKYAGQLVQAADLVSAFGKFFNQEPGRKLGGQSVRSLRQQRPLLLVASLPRRKEGRPKFPDSSLASLVRSMFPDVRLSSLQKKPILIAYRFSLDP